MTTDRNYGPTLAQAPSWLGGRRQLVNELDGMDAIERKIAELISAKVAPDLGTADLLADAGLDSLAFAELLSEIESEFQVKLDDEVLECESIAELAEMVREANRAGRAEDSNQLESSRSRYR